MNLRIKNLKFMVSVLLVISLFLAGCKPAVSTTTSTTPIINLSTTTSTSTITNTTSVPTTPETTSPPYFFYIIVNPLPKIGETAELVLTVNTNDPKFYLNNPGTENAKAWIEFRWTNPNGSYLEAKQSVLVPVSDVVVRGDASWQGNYKEKGKMELHCTIQLPKEGVWRIEGYFTGEGWKEPSYTYREFASSENTAVIMHSNELKASSLAYLDNFNYGVLRDKRKIDYLSEQFDPVIMELDISKAPKVDEEATLTCTVASLHDVPDYSLSIYFYRRLPDNNRIQVPGSNLLVKGELQWQGNLKQAEPTIFSTTIKFPEDDDWEIYAEGKSQEDIKNLNPGYSDTIDINISPGLSSYGWKPLRAVNTNTTPTTAISTATTGTNPQTNQAASSITDSGGSKSIKWIIVFIAIIGIVIVAGLLYCLLKIRKSKISGTVNKK